MLYYELMEFLKLCLLVFAALVIAIILLDTGENVFASLV
jgi:hypothetical protein